MKFLIDNALSSIVAECLQETGYDAVHVRDYELQAAPDDVILKRAADEDRIVVSADTDFGTLLALRSQTKPSVILFRSGSPHHPEKQAELLLANVSNLSEDLEHGCVIIIEAARIRIRLLPIGGGE